jgi:hypothetical protein
MDVVITVVSLVSLQRQEAILLRRLLLRDVTVKDFRQNKNFLEREIEDNDISTRNSEKYISRKGSEWASPDHNQLTFFGFIVGDVKYQKNFFVESNQIEELEKRTSVINN